MQGEVRELKKRVEDFEYMYNEVQKESKARLKEVEESQMKVAQLQDTLERYTSCSSKYLQVQQVYSNYLLYISVFMLRLELNISNLESENQVLRQQALAASSNDDLAEEIEL